MLISKDTSKKMNENYTQNSKLRALGMDYYVLLQYKGRDFFSPCELKVCIMQNSLAICLIP